MINDPLPTSMNHGLDYLDGMANSEGSHSPLSTFRHNLHTPLPTLYFPLYATSNHEKYNRM